MTSFINNPYVISFAATFALSVLITRLMISANIRALPEERSAHSQPNPSAGGVAIVISFFTGAFIFFNLHPPPYGFSPAGLGQVAGTAVLGAGVSLLDDIAHVPYRFRLLVQAAIALAFFSVGLKIHCPPLQDFTGISVIEFLLTLLFIVFVMNAANFVDGLNGLLSGCVMVALPFMAATTLLSPGTLSSDYWVLLICLTLFAAISGFYVFNFPRGKIFMGDVGSIFIGLMVGVIALAGQKGQPLQPGWMLVHARLFLLIYPLGFIWFDPVFTVLRRWRLGRSMFEPNRDFLLHLLNRAGYSHAGVSGIYYLSIIVLGTMALLTPLGYMPFVGLALGYMALQAIFVLWVFRQARRKGVKI